MSARRGWRRILPSDGLVLLEAHDGRLFELIPAQINTPMEGGLRQLPAPPPSTGDGVETRRPRRRRR